MRKFPGLSTKRLILRDFTEADLATFAQYRSQPDVARYQSWDEYNLEQAKGFYRKQQALAFSVDGSWYQIAIADKTDDSLLGDCVIHFIEGDDAQVEIGFTLNTEHQGKGYAKEAIGALMAFIFNDLQKHRITAVTDVLNTGSIKLLESLGFRREAHLVENIFFKGEWGSEYIYAMLRREFIA